VVIITFHGGDFRRAKEGRVLEPCSRNSSNKEEVKTTRKEPAKYTENGTR